MTKLAEEQLITMINENMHEIMKSGCSIRTMEQCERIIFLGNVDKVLRILCNEFDN